MRLKAILHNQYNQRWKKNIYHKLTDIHDLKKNKQNIVVI